MDDDFHIIAAAEGKEKRKSPIFIYIPVIVLLLLAGIVIRNLNLLQKQQVEGVHTETKDESIRFDTPKDSPASETTALSPTNATTKISGTPSATKTIILKSIGAEDGFVGNSGIVGVNTAIKIGDDGENNFRGFVSLVLDDIPQGTTIHKATLRIYQTSVVGNPFGVHGTIQIDHLIYGTLNADSYNLDAEEKSFATIPQSTSAGWKEVDVTKELKNDLSNARAQSQYRIHFTNEKTKGTTENMVYFESASNSELSGQTPQLVVTY